eukprot:2276921-Amphidinium_carterae.1
MGTELWHVVCWNFVAYLDKWMVLWNASWRLSRPLAPGTAGGLVSAMAFHCLQCAIPLFF